MYWFDATRHTLEEECFRREEVICSMRALEGDPYMGDEGILFR